MYRPVTAVLPNISITRYANSTANLLEKDHCLTLSWSYLRTTSLKRATINKQRGSGSREATVWCCLISREMTTSDQLLLIILLKMYRQSRAFLFTVCFDRRPSINHPKSQNFCLAENDSFFLRPLPLFLPPSTFTFHTSSWTPSLLKVARSFLVPVRRWLMC